MREKLDELQKKEGCGHQSLHDRQRVAWPVERDGHPTSNLCSLQETLCPSEQEGGWPARCAQYAAPQSPQALAGWCGKAEPNDDCDLQGVNREGLWKCFCLHKSEGFTQILREPTLFSLLRRGWCHCAPGSDGWRGAGVVVKPLLALGSRPDWEAAVLHRCVLSHRRVLSCPFGLSVSACASVGRQNSVLVWVENGRSMGGFWRASCLLREGDVPQEASQGQTVLRNKHLGVPKLEERGRKENG